MLFEANALEDKTIDYDRRMTEREQLLRQRESKMQVEHSAAYIGYKIFWLIKLALDGKAFPSGPLSSFKWRMYVFDIARFVTEKHFLRWLLEFDAARFFTLILPLYVGYEAFQYISTQDGFVARNKEEVAGLGALARHDGDGV